MPRYNNFIAKIFTDELGTSKLPLEFGAGIGTLSQIFEKKTGIKPICIEIDNKNKSYLLERKFRVFDDISKVGLNVDAVFSSNVLEHIEDDLRILKQLHKHTTDEAKLVLYLPAFPFLFSGLDKAVGHFRRYGKNSISKKLKNVGFSIDRIYYADCIGFFASLLFRVWGFDGSVGLGSPKSLRLYDHFFFPLSRIFDAIGFRFLFGKNIVVVARKNNFTTT